MLELGVMIERGRPTLGCYLALIAPALLAADMVWENTALSWNHGPQMIGFTLTHTAGIILFPAIFASIAWVLVSLCLPTFRARKWRLSNLLGALGIVVLLGVASLPYGFWVGTFASRIAQGPYATEFLTYMAALGERSAVQALLDRGVGVNTQERDGTALHGAAVQGELEVMELLIARGADVNAINVYGDSPLANAIQGRHRQEEAKALLEKHGAKLVRGSEEQRDRVIREQVPKDMEKYDRGSPSK